MQVEEIFMVLGEFFVLQKIVSSEFVQVSASVMPVFNRSYIGAVSSEKLGISCLTYPMRQEIDLERLQIAFTLFKGKSLSILCAVIA